MIVETSPYRTSRRDLMIAGGALALVSAPSGGVRATVRDTIAAKARPIRTIEAGSDDYDDLASFAEAVGDARIVQLGESSHGSGTDFKAKARLVEFLHARMGFDVLVWESGLHAMREVNAGFRAGVGSVAAARRGVFGIWSGAAEVKPLFDYATLSQGGPRPLEMAGFDCQFTARGADQALAASLRAFAGQLREPGLRTAAEADAAVAVAAYAKVAARTASEADVLTGEAAIDRLLAAMNRPQGPFERVHGAREIGFMARALESLRVFTRLRFGTLPGRPGAVSAPFKDPTASFNRREAQNARNLRWLVEQGYPGRKLIVWAHNVHVINAAFAPAFSALRRQPLPGDMVPMGLSTARAFGKSVYTVGLTSFAGADRWVNGDAPAMPIPAAGPNSLEARLHELGQPYLFLNIRDLDPGERRRLGRRVFVPSPGSSASSPNGLFPGPDVVAAFDGVLFIDQARPATPVAT